MSDSDSIKSEEVSKPKYKGYYCEKCDYKTKKIDSFVNHVTRKVPCYVVKDYSYGIARAIEKYEKRSEEILNMLDDLKYGQEIDLNKMNKYLVEVERLGRANPNFKQEDVDDIRDIISENMRIKSI